MEEDLFNFEDPQDPIEQPEVAVPEEVPEQLDSDKTYLDMLLEARGIDKDNIQVYDEENNLTNVQFDSLTEQEKFDILNSEDTPAIDDDELQTLNYLRQNKMTLNDFANWQKQLGVQEYLSQQAPTTELDSYTDEEVIAYDLIQRFGDQMTDQEIDAEIEKLKETPETFAKRVGLLRQSYKEEALAQQKLYEQQEATKRAEDEKVFINTYNTALQGIDSIQGIELDNNDKNELMQFVLQKDQNGRTEFSKAMDDPASVLQMAWFLLHGEDAMSDVVDYFKKEISKREKNAGTRVATRPKQTTQSDSFKF